MTSLQMRQQLVPGLLRLGRRCSVPRRIRLVDPLRAFLCPPRGGTGFSSKQTGCHLIGVYRVPRAGLEAWLGVL